MQGNVLVVSSIKPDGYLRWRIKIKHLAQMYSTTAALQLVCESATFSGLQAHLLNCNATLPPHATKRHGIHEQRTQTGAAFSLSQ